MPQDKTKPVRGLVLAGGGAKGSYQVGAYQALQELGWQPDIITGASVGSLNGVMLTMGKVQELKELWLSLNLKSVVQMPENDDPGAKLDFLQDTLRSGGMDVEPLGETIQKYLDEDAIRNAPIRFGLMVTELDGMKSIPCPVENIPQGKILDYLLASSACFPALRPREIDGVKYIDGGWRDNMPCDLAAAMGATELVAINVDGVGITKPNTTGLPTTVIRSHWNLGPTLEFNAESAAHNMALGYLDALRTFGRMGGTAYGILPAEDDFLKKFSVNYQAVLAAVRGRAPQLALTENMARQKMKYPAPYTADLLAPTRAALAPLELAAEVLGVDATVPYTPKMLGLTILGSFDKDPADKYPALLQGEEAKGMGGVTERAMAAAVPEDFITAVVCKALGEMTI